MHTKKHRGLVVLIATVVLVLAVGFGSAISLSALWDSSTAVKINAREIENSTLIIGTHLIHLSALTDEVLKVAKESATESQQYGTYYKSELAEGTWFDITSANSLTDITTGGVPVTDTIIEALFITHHTKKDGITYDLRTNLPISIFDVKDPYNLEVMPEIMPLKLHYDVIRDKEIPDDDKEGKARRNKVKEFLTATVPSGDPKIPDISILKNDATDEADASLAALKGYNDVLKDNGGKREEMDAVEKVMAAVDASRRYEVFTILEMELNWINEGVANGTYGSDTSFNAAVNDSISNVTTALSENKGNMLSEGTTVATRETYAASISLINNAKALNHAACDLDVIKLMAIANIMDGKVANKEGELNTLTVLISKATDGFTTGVSSGETVAYRLEVSRKSAKVLKDSVIKGASGAVSVQRSELEYFIDAEVLRLKAAEAVPYLEGRLKAANGYFNIVQNDAFKSAYDGQVQLHVDYLTEKVNEAKKALGGNELDKLIVEKAKLQGEFMAALDKNDLVKAKGLEEQIGTLAKKISDMDNGEVSGVTGETALELQKQASEIIKNNTDGSPLSANDKNALNDCINALGGLVDVSYNAVFPSLKVLHKEMVRERDVNDNKSFDDSIALTEDIIINNKAVYDASQRETLNTDDLKNKATDYLNGTGTGSGGVNGDGTGGGGTGGDGTGGSGTGDGTGGSGTGDGTGGSGTGDGTGGDGTGDGTGGSGTGDGTGGSGAGDGTGTGDGTGDGTGGTGAGDGTGGSGSGSGNDKGTDKTAGSKPSGKSIADLSDNEKAIVQIAALEMHYAQTKNPDSLALLKSLATNQADNGNPYVFTRVSNGGIEYLPLPIIAKQTGMRYVWKQNSKEATLAKGKDYYSFSIYSAKVIRDKAGTKTEEMTAPTKYKGVLYIPEDYAYNAFKMESLSLTGTDAGVVLTAELRAFAEELLSVYLQ